MELTVLKPITNFGQRQFNKLIKGNNKIGRKAKLSILSTLKLFELEGIKTEVFIYNSKDITLKLIPRKDYTTIKNKIESNFLNSKKYLKEYDKLLKKSKNKALSIDELILFDALSNLLVNFYGRILAKKLIEKNSNYLEYMIPFDTERSAWINSDIKDIFKSTFVSKEEYSKLKINLKDFNASETKKIIKQREHSMKEKMNEINKNDKVLLEILQKIININEEYRTIINQGLSHKPI